MTREPLAKNPNVVAAVVKIIGNVLRDANDPTLSENAKDIRTDIVIAAMRYYHSTVTEDMCSALFEAFNDKDNEHPMEVLVAALGSANVDEMKKLREQLFNLYEGFRNDRPQSPPSKSIR